MKKAEISSDLKVKYGKTGKVMYREISINTPYLRGEKLFRAVIDPYANQESKSRTLSPKTKTNDSDKDARAPNSSHNLAQSDNRLMSQPKLPKLLNTPSRHHLLSQSSSGKTYSNPYAPTITKKKPTSDVPPPKSKVERTHQLPIVPTVKSQNFQTPASQGRQFYVVCALLLV